MSSILILGLEDVYTREQLFQLRPDLWKTTVEFEKLVRAASEIAMAKDKEAENVEIVIQQITVPAGSLSR